MARERGSIRWHRGGWEIRVSANGRSITRRHRAPNTRAGRRSAEDALEQLLQELAIGADGDMTVGDLLDLYELTRGHAWSPSTKAAHRNHVISVRSAYGAIEVARLTRADIVRTNARWTADGKAPATVRRRHSLLSAALNFAEVELEIIRSSPARNLKLPSIERLPKDLPLMGDVLAAVGRIDHGRLRVVSHLAAATGARRGELLALRWSDLDLDAGTPSVLIARAVSADRTAMSVKGTKTGSIRRVAIDPGTVSVVRSWRSELLAETLRLGGPRPADASPVLPAPGDPSMMWEPNQVTQRWRSWRSRAGFEPLSTLKFHDLRHLHATTLLAAGVTPAVVSARLGHASTQMTHDVYGHAIPAHDLLAAEVIAQAIAGCA